MSTFFLRDACERLGKPDVHLSPATLDLFARYWWPATSVSSETKFSAVAMSPPGGEIGAGLSPDLAAPESGTATGRRGPMAGISIKPGNLATSSNGSSAT